MKIQPLPIANIFSPNVRDALVHAAAVPTLDPRQKRILIDKAAKLARDTHPSLFKPQEN